jgi:hypothetical protein
MPGNRSEDQSKSDRTLYNIKADYSEVDHDFRQRLERMLPDDLAARVQSVLRRRLAENSKDAV